jgi:hypothetical protein
MNSRAPSALSGHNRSSHQILTMIEKWHAGGEHDSTTAPRNSQNSCGLEALKRFKPTRRHMFRDAIMCSGVSIYASGCSRQRSGYGSQCCAVQWYYDNVASCTKPTPRLQHNMSRGLVAGLPSFRFFMAGLLTPLEAISIAPIQERRMLLAVKFTLPASCTPTARANCSNSIEQVAG